MTNKRLLAGLTMGIFLAASNGAFSQGRPGGGPGAGGGHGGPGGGGPGASFPSRPGGGGPGAGHPGRPGPGPGMPGGPRPGGHHRPGPPVRPIGPGPYRPPMPVYRPDPPYQHWSRGQPVPMPYRGPQYRIDNWAAYGLAPPPRGYYWINVGADYFLIGLTTGIVMQSILGR